MENKEIKNTATSDWENYFTWRGVTPVYYENYRPTSYLQLALPADKRSCILDIGCGYGQVLRGVQSLGYSNSYGIEPSESACKQAASYGLNVLRGYVQDLGNKIPCKADFAYMFHVLEHIPKQDVIPTLKYIRENMLKEGGRILIAVPNAQSFTGPYWRYEDWTHETLFTSGSLLYVLRAAGFKQAEIYDTDCLLGVKGWGLFAKKLALRIYKFIYWLGCKASHSATHEPSPKVFSFEVKAVAVA